MNLHCALDTKLNVNFSGNSEEWVTKQKKVRPEKKAVQQESTDNKSKRSTSKSDRGKGALTSHISQNRANMKYSVFVVRSSLSFVETVEFRTVRI